MRRYHSDLVSKMAKSDSKKREALSLLSKGISQVRVAKLINVDRRTVVRWLAEPEFKKQLIESRRTHLENVLNEGLENPAPESREKLDEPKQSQLENLVSKAICVLNDIISHPETRTSDRLRASELVLKLVGSDKVIQNISPQIALVDSDCSPGERKNQIDNLLQRRELLKARIAKLK